MQRPPLPRRKYSWYSFLLETESTPGTWCGRKDYVNKKFQQVIKVKVKVKCTLVQALRLCTGRTAHRGSRGIALLFLDHDTRRGEGSASRPCRSLPPETPGTHCTGGWVDPRAGLDRCGKSRPHRDSIPDRLARSQSLYRLSYSAHSASNSTK